MSELIAETERYIIRVDKLKNRMLLELKGFWSTLESIRNYIPDLEAAAAVLTPPFTALVDVREMRTPGAGVKDYMVEAQKVVIAAGLARSAEVFPRGVSKEIELESYSKESQLVRRGFKTIAEAEAWLDE